MALTDGLVAHYLLNNNADDCHGAFDGSESGTVDFTGGHLDPLLGSVTIPSTGGAWCSYWIDSGTGFTFASSSTVPSSLATDNYSNLRVYNAEKTGADLTQLLDEGYYPKPLTEPTTVNLLAHYPLTGTAEDSTGNYDGTENNLTYIDNDEFGSVADFNGTSEYVSVPNILSNITDTISVSAWVFMDGSTASSFFGDDDDTTTNQINFTPTHPNGSYYIDFGNLDTEGRLTGTTPAEWLNKWVNFVVINANNTLFLFVNGQLYASKSNTTAISGKSTAWIGLYNSNYLSGNIRGLRVYNRELLTQEITDIYNYEKNFRSIDIDDGLIAYYPLKNNSLDNYHNEYDATADAGVTFDGTKATLPNGDNITFPSATGFVEAYYVKDGEFLSTTTESDLNSLTDCELSEVRKYSRSLSSEEIAIITPSGFTASATLTLTATASASYIEGLHSEATLTLTATANASMVYQPLPIVETFTFVQEIEQVQVMKVFKFVQEIEQPKESTIIQRVNT